MKTNFKNIANKTFLILAFVSFSFFVSCSNDGNPEAVAEKFLNHINKGEFNEAKEYCDEQTASLIGMMESMVADKKEEMKNNKEKIEIISSEVKDDKAKVKYKSTGGEAAGVEKSLDLVKVDGKWKVTFDKENANKEQGAKPATDVPAIETDTTSTPVDTMKVAQ